MKPRLITIAGGSGSGKSHLARMLHHALSPQATVLTLDHFYHDLSHLTAAARNDVNFDDPLAIDWQSASRVINDLLANRSTEIPIYDFVSHTRFPESNLLHPTLYIVLEGLWPLTNEEIRNRSLLSVFIDCPAEVRLQRRLQRDAVERGRSEESVRRQFFEHVAPMHEIHVQPQVQVSDLVLPHDFSEADISSILAHPHFLAL